MAFKLGNRSKSLSDSAFSSKAESIMSSGFGKSPNSPLKQTNQMQTGRATNSYSPMKKMYGKHKMNYDSPMNMGYEAHKMKQSSSASPFKQKVDTRTGEEKKVSETSTTGEKGGRQYVATQRTYETPSTETKTPAPAPSGNKGTKKTVKKASATSTPTKTPTKKPAKVETSEKKNYRTEYDTVYLDKPKIDLPKKEETKEEKVDLKTSNIQKIKEAKEKRKLIEDKKDSLAGGKEKRDAERAAAAAIAAKNKDRSETSSLGGRVKTKAKKCTTC